MMRIALAGTPRLLPKPSAAEIAVTPHPQNSG
jgi:hypothetical protein